LLHRKSGGIPPLPTPTSSLPFVFRRDGIFCLLNCPSAFLRPTHFLSMKKFSKLCIFSDNQNSSCLVPFSRNSPCSLSDSLISFSLQAITAAPNQEMCSGKHSLRSPLSRYSFATRSDGLLFSSHKTFHDLESPLATPYSINN